MSRDLEQLESLAGDYPTLINPLLGEVKTLRSTLTQQSEEIGKLKGDLHFSTIKKVHPDLDAISASDDFLGWISRQPDAIQRIRTEGSTQDVIWLLSEYKRAVGDPSKQTFTKKPKFTRAQIAAMSTQEFSEKEAEIDAAVAAGEIV